MNVSKGSALVTPANKSGVKQPDFDEVVRQRNLFLLMLTNMTWQLAVAVLLPVLGGYYLDQHFGTTPWLLVVGALLALAGVIGVMINLVRLANRRATETFKTRTNPKDNK